MPSFRGEFRRWVETPMLIYETGAPFPSGRRPDPEMLCIRKQWSEKMPCSGPYRVDSCFWCPKMKYFRYSIIFRETGLQYKVSCRNGDDLKSRGVSSWKKPKQSARQNNRPVGGSLGSDPTPGDDFGMHEVIVMFSWGTTYFTWC